MTHDHANGNRPSLVGSLLTGSELLAALGQLDDAVVLTSAVVKGELSGLTGLGAVAATQEAITAAARERLEDSVYQAATATGSALAYEEVVAYALDAIDTARAELAVTDA